MSSRARINAPTPFTPPILCAESVSTSAPSAPISTAMRPAACTASTCSRPPAACTIAATSAIGWITPVSLLATLGDERPHRLRQRHARARSTRPSASTGISAMASRANRPPVRTDGCSIAEIKSLPRGFSLVGGLDRRRQRERIRLGSAGRKDHVGRSRADKARNVLARVLDQPPRRAALGVSRRRVPGQRKRGRQRVAASGRNGAVAFQSK